MKAIKNIMNAIEQGIFSDTTQGRLLELESERADLEVAVAKEQLRRPTVEREKVVYFLERFRGGDVNDKSYCKNIIDTFINSVWLYDAKIIITYNFSGDDNKVTYKMVQEAIYNATNSVSDKLPNAPPKEKQRGCHLLAHVAFFSAVI